VRILQQTAGCFFWIGEWRRPLRSVSQSVEGLKVGPGPVRSIPTRGARRLSYQIKPTSHHAKDATTTLPTRTNGTNTTHP
jgi:hypothetical protein